MRVFSISSGLSEIQLNGTKSASEAKKAYIWPVYQEGKVEAISPVKRGYSAPIYFKPSQDQKEKIMEILQNKDLSYNEKGYLQKSNTIVEPGVLFTAFA